jgi:hypothetical protein
MNQQALWPSSRFTEVRGGLRQSQHAMPVRPCTCFHWGGWPRQGRWEWWRIRSHFTRTDVVEIARAAAKGYDRDGKKAEAKAMRLYARRLLGRLR